MSSVKWLLDSLLWEIYGAQQLESQQRRHQNRKQTNISRMTKSVLGVSQEPKFLQNLSVRNLIDISAILKLEIRLMSYFLERVLISRDRNRRHQEILCEFVDAVLHVEYHDTHPRMRFSLSPPPPKATAAAHKSSPTMPNGKTSARSEEGPAEAGDDAASDYKQWLHAMKLVARLPGGMPPEFRRKLWLSLAEKYLKSKNVDWTKEEEKCFCEEWREDDEELGIQIVKDLHRTGSNLCTGPAGNINQAKLKRILLGYARYNPEVGYCQGFNMLGALILQVMEKQEVESMKVMIYLVEGVLPTGYFCGSMGGLQADMGVFRELMTSKLPRLAKHLQKLQGPIENAYEPPLTNVFTMQWFLTMFCTCLPMTCVLRVWDLVLIEGSDVLLRTALVLWSLLEERVLTARTADDFYCKMGSFSSELLNGHLIDSNGLIERVVQLGPIADIQRLRDKHLYNIAPLKHKQGLQLYFDDEEPEIDEDSHLAVATVWGIPWGRRGSGGNTANSKSASHPESKDRLALDISLLKKQYDRLRERQKQAHIILTTACSTAARQGSAATTSAVPVNQLLIGRSAIVTNKGRRMGPPAGAIPPARKPSLPTVLHKTSRPPQKQLRRGETLQWRDTDISKRRRDSLTWKEIKADRLAASTTLRVSSEEDLQPRKLRTRFGKSDSSSYSDESDGGGSSTDTSLCDEDDPASTGDKAHGRSSAENSPKRRSKMARKHKELSEKFEETAGSRESSRERRRPKSWAATNDEIPFMLMDGSGSPVQSDKKERLCYEELSMKEEEDSATESDRVLYKVVNDLNWTDTQYSRIAGDLATTTTPGQLHIVTDILELPVITSASQMSPMPDITQYLNTTEISPLPIPKPLFLDSTNSLGSGDGEEAKQFDVNEDGVTNEYFERVNNVERPTNLDLFYSLNEEDSIRNAFERKEEESLPEASENSREALEIEKKKASKEEERKTIEGCENDEIDEGSIYTKKRVENGDNVEGENEDTSQQKIEDHPAQKSLDKNCEKSLDSCTDLPASLSKKGEIVERFIKSPIEKDSKNRLQNEDTTRKDLMNASYESERSIHRKYSLNEASSKRRDPRRLTIARSFTIETADRCETSEGNASEKSSYFFPRQTKFEGDISERVDSFSPSKKGIPSTADLEDRFNRLEKKLSESKDNEGNSLNGNERKRSSSQVHHVDLENEPRSSTKELEDHFENLETKSSETLNAVENYIEKETEKPEKVEDKQYKYADLHKIQSEASIMKEEMKLKSETSKPETFTEDIKERSERYATPTSKRSSIPTSENSHFQNPGSPSEGGNFSLSDIQSTKDKEDRFNAYERQMSSRSTSPNNNISKRRNSKNDQDKEGERKKESTKNYPYSPSTGRKPTAIENQEMREEKAEIVNEPKSAPSKIPSTAELEDRFNALERKQSASRSSSPKNKKEPPDDMKTSTINPDKLDLIDKQRKSSEKNGKDLVSSKNLKTDDETARTKSRPSSPPSTEQLEKRFQALENTRGSENKIARKEIVKPKESSKEKTTSQTIGKDSKIKEGSKSKSEEIKPDPKVSSETNILSKENLSENTTEHSNPRKDSMEEYKKSAMQHFESQCNVINDQLGQQGEKHITTASTETVHKDHLKNFKYSRGPPTVRGERRASEPPITTDLENRYEALQRRMSGKTSSEAKSQRNKVLEKSVTVDEALERIEDKAKYGKASAADAEQDNSSTKPKSQMKEKSTSERATSISKEEFTKRRVSEPPTTEELEKRYENLKRRMSKSRSDTVDESASELRDINKNRSPRKISNAQEETFSALNNIKDDPKIPVPPPMQSNHFPLVNATEQHQRRALVEELQSKMTPHDENLKPSDINPHRKTHRITVADETSETHAITASRRLKKDELSWHMQPNKMVRRFSDLPSRADLENRVHFLEQQLSSKLTKQRSASDSEVASKARQRQSGGDGEKLHTSSRAYNECNLESRVRALEKQLSENSFQLLETMPQKCKTNRDPTVESASASRPNAEDSEMDSKTGMELVRYTHYGEIEETESTKPINISINIKMHLSKDIEEKTRKTMNVPTTEELEKRLEEIEKHISKSCNLVRADPPKGLEENKIEEVVKLNQKDAKESSEQNLVTRTESFSDENKKVREKKEKLRTENEENESVKAEDEDKELEVKINTSSRNRQKEDKADDEKLKDSILSVDSKEDVTFANRKVETESSNQNREKLVDDLKDEKSQKEPADDTDRNKSKDVSDKEEKSEGSETVSAAETAALAKTEDRQNATEDNSNASKIALTDSKNMVLLLDNEPKPVKVRRLTRANTEELEGLLQALEKQLSQRNLIKSDNGKLIRADSLKKPEVEVHASDQSQAISELSKEIQEFTGTEKEKPMRSVPEKEKVEEYDWGPDPVKRHLKRSTVYLPSTKELVARYRSLERQIRLLEDVEKIDVEQRLNEIERKIKLQYSLSHEKDLFKFLDLCEGKLPEDEATAASPKTKSEKSPSHSRSPSQSRSREKTPHNSPSRSRERSPRTSPSASRSASRSPYASPARQIDERTNDDRLRTTEDLEYRYRVLDLVRSKSKESLCGKSKQKSALKKQPIHPLEMLLDSSPDDSDIPTTGELEHRIRILDDHRKNTSPPRTPKQRSSSPTIADIKRAKMIEERRPKTPIHELETLVASPTKRELPTEKELEARMHALEEEQKFDFKMQKNYREFNQKLKDVISPSLSFEEFKADKSREQSPKRPITPKSAIRDHEAEYKRDETILRSTSPKMIRFREDEETRPRSSASIYEARQTVGTTDGVLKIIEENSKMLHRILKKTLADSNSSSLSDTAAAVEGLEVLGPRLMRETSPLRRTGTHTGIPLRTDDNINDRLNSIKNTIKSIDSLCEEKPLRRERCQRYIDSLCNDSVYFATPPSNKSSLEDLAYKRRSGDYAPSIQVSDHSQRPSEHLLSRSLGSAESVRSKSPLRAASPLHHRSTRDLRRDISPRRRYGDEEREECESRVRTRTNLLPNYCLDDSSELLGRSSLTKFHKVDNELDMFQIDGKTRSSSRSVSRSPLRSTYGSGEETQAAPTSRSNTTLNTNSMTTSTVTTSNRRPDWDGPASPYRQTSHSLLGYDSLVHSSAPAYNPAKLEIRHTTVTSTFYDRLLTEKQLEKSLSRPSSRSPLVSPSVGSKNYLDITSGTAMITNPKSSGGNSPTTPVRSVGTVGLGLGSGSTFQASFTGSYTTTTNTATAITNTITTQKITNQIYTATATPTGNSSVFPNSYLTELPSVTSNKSDVIQTQSKAALVGSGLNLSHDASATTAINASLPTNFGIGVSNITTTTTTVPTNSYTSSLSMRFTVTGTDTTTTTTGTTPHLSSTGVYNTLMPLNLKPLSEIGIQLGPHQQTTDTAFSNPTLYNINLPKS